MILHEILRQIGRKRAIPALGLAACLLLPITGVASNGKLTLAWSSNTEPDIAGYRLYYGTSPGSYGNRTDVGLNTVYAINGLGQGTYYFVVSAYNTSGQESGYSNEVEFALPPPPTVTQVSDTKGPAGMEISIFGENLVAGTQVDFNGIAGQIVRLTHDRAVVIVPPGFSSGPITVTTPGGSVISANFTITPALSEAGLTVPEVGSAEYATIGPSSTSRAAYAVANVPSGAASSGFALLSYSEGGDLSSIVSMPASVPMKSGRAFVDQRLQFPSGTGNVDIKTGFSLLNPGPDKATLELTLRNQNGKVVTTKTIEVAQGEHVAKYLDELFSVPDQFGLGSLEFDSDQPVFAAALRLTVNQAGKLLLCAIPVADLTKPETAAPLYFPRMNIGDGYQTSVLLSNTSDKEQTGKIVLLTQSGTIINTTHQGSTPTISPYRILPGGVSLMVTSPGDAFESGWVKVVPDPGSQSPSAVELIGLTVGGSLVAETSSPPVLPTNHVLLYVDRSRETETGLSIANPEPTPARIQIRAVQGNVQAGNGSELNVPANGAASSSVGQLFGNLLPAEFQGILDVSSDASFVAAGFQSIIGANGDIIFTSIPVVDPLSTASAPLIFPQIADGNGYQTRFVFVNPGPDPIPVQLSFRDDLGNPAAAGK